MPLIPGLPQYSLQAINWAPDPLLGDANADGAVDLADLSIVLNNFGKTTSLWSDGNFDHRPTIDLTDLAYVLNDFGQTNPNASSSQSPITNDQLPIPAPEPSTLLLAIPAAAQLRRTTPKK